MAEKQWREVNGVRHLIMTAKEWAKLHSDYKGKITEETRALSPGLFPGLPVGTRLALDYDPTKGTCLVPVVIVG